MSNPPVIAEPFYEIDIEFVDESTAQVYMVATEEAFNEGDASALAALIYNAIKANSNTLSVSQNLWGEDVQGSFTAAVEPPPPPEITYNPRH